MELSLLVVKFAEKHPRAQSPREGQGNQNPRLPVVLVAEPPLLVFVLPPPFKIRRPIALSCRQEKTG